MYIKQIIIQGFRSYKDQTVIEPFSPGTNVIVGRNGSGKSNFFAAIRFVLSDAYTQMSREERQALLHEGSGSAVVSAYVEIIFDNSDERFPTGGKEVVVRRTIGLKKDEYSVDRKAAQKSEVTNLLEAAGFSRSNPYYIVPQGRVTALTNMKESDRLTLLKEVAGTQVYEARRTESLKILTETAMKRQKITELLAYIKDRLKELEEEKEELKGFQDKDRERRCLEYAFYHQEQVTIQEALDEIDSARQEGLDGTDQNRAAFLEGEKAVAKLSADVQKLQRESEMLRRDRRDLEEDRREGSRAQAKAELKVKSLADGQSAQEQAKAQHAAELESVKAEIAAKEKELAKVSPEYTKRKAKEVEFKQTLDTAEGTRNRLFNKQTRNSKYKNRAERDAYLKSQIQELSLALGDQKAHRLDADESVKSAQGSIHQLEGEVAGIRAQLEGWGPQRTALADVLNKAAETVDKLDEERKLLRREDRNLESSISYARNERDEAEKKLAGVMDGATARGLATIRRLKKEQDIPGAYGTLAELLEVNEAYRIAVERTADGSLFHYVVDNAETATYLANYLHKHHGGRLTFMPLSQLRPKSGNLPRANDVVPLLSKIKYDAKFDRAFQQVFGRWVVCASLAIANQYSRSHGVNGVTPDGDTTNKRGAMTGGYIDPRASRLEAVHAVNRARDEYERLLAQSDELIRQMEQKEQEVTRAKGEQQKAEQKLRQLDDGFEPLRHELGTKMSRLERERSRLESAVARRESVEKSMKEFGDNISAFEAELTTEFKKALTANEERQLEQLGTQIQELHHQWSAISKQRRDLEQRKQMLEVDLRQNLQLKLDQLNSQAFENVASSSSSGSLKEAQKELKKIHKAVAAVEARLREADEKLDSLQGRVEGLESEKVQREQEQQEIAARIEKQQKKIERGLQRKALLMAQAAECAKNIRDLGVLPEEAFGKYENMAANTITNRLKKVNEALKKFKHVNKKAFEQYNSFTQQEEALVERHLELDESVQSIDSLVKHLDQRKDEAIERTFKQVSKEFATIFEKLVPAGHGRLVIQRKTDRRQEPADSDEEGERGGVENYTGVGISVSFNSKMFDEQQKIQQLSGGQKSLCALCLIFALQQTESSPMVIFDEVDANLDAQYRTAVAALLDSISKEAGTQFICTTFRPEIVHVADKCYGVTFRNKTSSIDCVPTEEALNFVDGQKA